MKRLIIFFFAFTCILMANAQFLSPRVTKSTADDYVLLLQQKGYMSYSLDVSAFKDETYLIEPVITHFKNGERVDNPIKFSVAFTNRDSQTLCEKVRIGFIPTDKPTVRTLSFFVTETGALTMPLVFDEVKDPETGEIANDYGFRPFTIDGIEPGKFIPVALCGANWYDNECHVFRFCGENEITQAMTESIFKSLKEFYVIGLTIRKM